MKTHGQGSMPGSKWYQGFPLGQKVQVYSRSQALRRWRWSYQEMGEGMQPRAVRPTSLNPPCQIGAHCWAQGKKKGS